MLTDSKGSKVTFPVDFLSQGCWEGALRYFYYFYAARMSELIC